ncbi:hypothetical protein F5H01DRAFT_353685 [Linnemannia elongata]|nr:hypothetical protein F5H01DRAFT_353685 [Linnemannia elongata]
MLKNQLTYMLLFAVFLIMLEFAQAGDHQPGEGCIMDSQCTEGYKCLRNRELQVDRCAKEDNPTPVSSENTSQETPKDVAPNPFDAVIAALANIFPTKKD